MWGNRPLLYPGFLLRNLNFDGIKIGVTDSDGCIFVENLRLETMSTFIMGC